MFGLTNEEGNHGEDVKEYYFYLDATPTSSYLKYRYRYPLTGYPYADLVETNRNRGRNDLEYELLDTGVFDQDRYVDVDVEYAKNAPEDIAIRITVSNRGAEWATVHLLPHLWFRNTWWKGAEKGTVSAGAPGTIVAEHERVRIEGALVRRNSDAPLHRERVEHRAPVGIAERDTPREGRVPRLRHPREDRRRESRPRGHEGGRALRAEHRSARIDRGPPAPLLAAPRPCSTPPPSTSSSPLASPRRTSSTCRSRRRDTPAEEANVMRQALAGMLWSKQHYFFDLDTWLEEHNVHPLRDSGGDARNRSWFHMINDDVISMPDKWEYPWYASWDLAFHTRRARDGRRGRGQAPALAHAERAVPPSERTAPRLRVELQRREPTRARVGDAPRLRDRARAARHRRRRVAEGRVPEAPRELHLVDQPQGPHRPQRVRGRLPRARQHRRLRPERTTADRRPPRAVRRHRVDGLLLAVHAQHRPRARGARRRCTARWC